MKKLITFLMLLSVFGIGNVWADNTLSGLPTDKKQLYHQLSRIHSEGVQYYTGILCNL